MTKKHFAALAAALADIQDPVTRRQVAGDVARICREDNPRFDRARFLSACHVTPACPCCSGTDGTHTATCPTEAALHQRAYA